jgi:hypothetical protein
MTPDLLDLDADADIVTENVRAVGTIYSTWLLEQAGAFRVLDQIADLFRQGLLPLGRGRVADALHRLWRRGERLTARERASLYARALGVPGGDAGAGEPNRDFQSLWLRFVVAVSMYAQPRGIRGLEEPPTRTKETVRAAARALAVNSSAHGGGAVRGAARKLIDEVQQMLGLLSEPELLRAFHARDVWQLVDRVQRQYLGGANNVTRYRALAGAGSRIVDWLANHATALQTPTAPGGSIPRDADLVDAAERWLSASAGETRSTEAKPDATDSAFVQRARLLSASRELVAALDLAGERDGVVAGPRFAALFLGPPGTGKTLAAHVLANALSVPLYRIDLAAATNKFIGETEKNLAAVFEHAEREGWALFFDEADALFGKRSEVNDAHDRYASMGINYLLKRLADYEGALILAASQPVDVDAVLAKEALRHRRWRVVRFPRPRA